MIELVGIAKTFGPVTALKSLSLTLKPGEILAVTGPSGAGKTTLCRLISGIDLPDRGEVRFEGENVNQWPPHGREIAYMFESFALYPQLSVFDNVAFPLRAPGRVQENVRERVEEILTLTEIVHLADRLPQALSGGQKQRVALCRALVQRPRAFLIDEPISHLDAKLRNRLRGDVRRRLKATGCPALWCTPDAMEAIAVADTVVVLIDGVVEQIGTPHEIYFKPANTKVARLVGDPTMNLLDGEIAHTDGHAVFHGEGIQLDLPQKLAEAKPGKITLGIRPTKIGLGDGQGLDAEVYAWEPFGKYAIISAKLGTALIRIKIGSTKHFEIGEPLNLTIDPLGLTLFDGVDGNALETTNQPSSQ